MDVFIDMLPLLSVIVAAAAVCFLLTRLFKSKRFNGWRGERKVARKLRKCMSEGDKLINDLYLIDPASGNSVQIDHVLLSVRGLFVVETKNISGDIAGRDSDSEWSSRRRDGTIGFTFYSPVKQNLAHIGTIKAVAETNAWAENVVVFVQGNIKNIQSTSVCSLRGLKNVVKRSEHPLSAQERDRIYAILIHYKKHPPVTKRKHRRNVKRRLKKR